MSIAARPFLRAAMDSIARKAIENMRLQFARDTIPAWVASMERRDAEKLAHRELLVAIHVFEIKMRATRRDDAAKRLGLVTFDVLLRGEPARVVPE